MKCDSPDCFNEARLIQKNNVFCHKCHDRMIEAWEIKRYDKREIEDQLIPEKTLKMTLPTDSNDRKNFPLLRGLLRYFPAALAGVSRTSKLGNDKHNPGQEMFHARNKSGDHGDCILRHLMDTEDLLAARERGINVTDQQILDEVGSLAWRALAYAQELHEKLGSPQAPGAKNGK